MQSELEIVWKDNGGKVKPVLPVYQQGHREKYMRALKSAFENGNISKSAYYKLREEYDDK